MAQPQPADDFASESGSLAERVAAIEQEIREREVEQPPDESSRVAVVLLRLSYATWRLVLGAYFVAVGGLLLALLALHVPLLREARLSAIYAACVTSFVLARFALSHLYRPCRHAGPLPSIAVIVPAMNEEDSIVATIEDIVTQEYPPHLLSVHVVDDGSTDDTWARIRECARRYRQVCALRFSRNQGKRMAMAAGIAIADAEVIVFVDSDSRLQPGALREIVRPFHDPRVAVVTGHADVANPQDSLLAQLQQARYWIAFRVAKAAESVFGAVTCASGCFSAYRSEALQDILLPWKEQTFLGKRSTFGDDRSLTNLLLEAGYRVQYQSTARCVTAVPSRLGQFLRQQNRWKKSWTRESIVTLSYVWRRNPAISVPALLTILFTLSAPVVLVHALVWGPIAHGASPVVYLVGLYCMALLYALYFGLRTQAVDWWAGMAFPILYVTLLAWQVYWSIATVQQSAWGTRSARAHRDPRPFRVDEVIEARPTRMGTPQLRLVPPAPVRGDPWKGMLVGVAAVVVSIAPLLAFLALDPTGWSMTTRARATLAGPPPLVAPPAVDELARTSPIAYADAVAVLAFPPVSDRPAAHGAMSTTDFAAVVAMLRASGMRAVSVDDVRAWQQGTRELPRNAVVLLLEDGPEGLAAARPLLDRADMVGNVVVTGRHWTHSPTLHASPRLLRSLRRAGWSVIAQGSRPGMQVRAGPGRSERAPYLAALAWRGEPGRHETYAEYEARARQELESSRRAVSAMTGAPVDGFAWPPRTATENGTRLHHAREQAARGLYDITVLRVPQPSRVSLAARDSFTLPGLVVHPDWTPLRIRSALRHMAERHGGSG